MLDTKQQLLSSPKHKHKPEDNEPLGVHSILSIYKRVYSFLQAPTIRFETEIAKAALRFVSTCQNDFLQTRPYTYLSRLIGTLYFFEKELVKRIQSSPESRHLLFRIIKLPSSKNVHQSQIGLIIATNLIQECEVFHQNHVLKAVRRIIPGIKEVPDSVYLFHDHKQSLVLLYIEIKKTRGNGFSTQEIKKLKELLSEELKLSVECLSHSLFFPRNEEEIYRNIVQLSRELKFMKDLPQVMISFQEQNGEWLRFTVIALRIFKPGSRPWQELSIALPRSIRFTLEQVSKLGTLRKKHPKEAAVFTFEVESSLFLRKNHSIDLRLARDYLARALKLMIGDFRDYNGGFLSKQNEQLEIIKTFLEEDERKQSFFIETLFYALSPPLIQTVLLPKAGKALISLFLEALKQDIPSQKTYLLLHQEKPEFVVAVLKTQQEKIEEFLGAEILKIPFHSYQFGHAFQQIDGYSYLCFVYQHPADFQLISFLQEAMNKWKQEQVKHTFNLKNNKILKINFQGGDPPSLNPHIGIELRCRSIQKSLFEGLTRLNPQGIPEMAAAEKVMISSCQKQFVFKLRPHQWSNGEEVTAYHFEKSWKKAITSTSHCLRPDLFYIIQNAKEVHLGKLPENAMGVRALNANTLEVLLAHPSPCFLELLAHPLFFPLYEEGEEPMVFNGPFLLRSWDRDHSLSLARNPYYWDAKNVFLSGIDITIISDSRVAFQMYQRGELDWIGDPFSSIPLDEVPRLLQSGQLKTKDVLGVSWLYCNTSFYPLSSSKIRRALAYAINRKEICDAIFFGHTPLRSPLPKTMTFLSEEELYRDGDVEEARILFAEGIKELDISFDAFAPLILNHSHIPGQKELASAVCSQWQRAFNINVQSVEKSWPALTTIFDKREYHIGGCYRHFFYSDPFYIFNLFKEPTNVHNASGWKHRQFQEFVNLASATSSLAERHACLFQAEKILLEEMPVIPTHHTTAQYLTRDKLKGIHLCHSGDVDFKWVYFDD